MPFSVTLRSFLIKVGALSLIKSLSPLPPGVREKKAVRDPVES